MAAWMDEWIDGFREFRVDAWMDGCKDGLVSSGCHQADQKIYTNLPDKPGPLPFLFPIPYLRCHSVSFGS